MIDNDKALRDLQDGHGGYNADVGKVSYRPAEWVQLGRGSQGDRQ